MATLQQDIRVRIDTFINGLPQVQALSAGIQKISSTPTKKITFGDARDTSQLAESVEKLAKAVNSLDDKAPSKLSNAFRLLSSVVQGLAAVPQAFEGVNVIKDLANTAPNLVSKLAGAGPVIREFFSAAKDKAAAGVSVVKEKVAGLVESLPSLNKGLVGGSAGLLGIGTAGTIAAGGLLAVVGAIAAILALVVVIPAIAVKLFSLAESAAETGSKFHDLSQQTGATVELISALAPVAEDSNASVDELAQGLGRFNKLIGDANSRSKEAIATLATFDLGPKEALDNTDAALEKVIKRILELPPGSQQAIAAQDAFGKSGAKLVPTLIATEGNLEKVKQKAKELGVYWTSEGAAAADEYGDKLSEVRRIVEGLANSTGRILIPQLLRLLRIMGFEMPKAGGAFATILRGIAAAAQVAANHIIVLAAAAMTLKSVPLAISATVAGVAIGSPGAGIDVLDKAFQQNKERLFKIADTPTPDANNGNKGLDFPGAGGGGGGKGGAGKPEDTFESFLGVDRAQAEAAFNLINDLIERQTKKLENEFEKRKISIRAFYAEQARLQTEAIDEELKKVRGLRNIEERRLANEIKNINPKGLPDNALSAEQRAKITNETLRTQEALIPLNERLITLQRDRGEVATQTAAKETEANERLAKEFIALDEQIASFEGLQSIDAIVERFRPIIAQLKAELSDIEIPDSVRESLQEQLDLVLKLRDAEIERARVANLIAVAQEKNAVIEADIDIILAKHSGNVLEEYRARLLIKPLVEEQIVNLQLALEKAIELAEVQQDPKTVEALKRQLAAVEEMKGRFKSVGDTIKDTFINSAVAGLEDFFLSLQDVFSGVKSLGDVFRGVALSIIQDISRIIAKLLAMKIVMAILNIAGAAAGGTGIPGAGGIGNGIPIDVAATGGEFSAAPGGRIIRVAEAGHDELVISTDPSIARRTASLLGRFIKRTGILPTFDGGFSSDSILSNISARIPSFGQGDFVSALGPHLAGTVGGDTINLGGVQLVFPNVRDARGFNVNSQAILRDARRGVEDATRKAKGDA